MLAMSSLIFYNNLLYLSLHKHRKTEWSNITHYPRNNIESILFKKKGGGDQVTHLTNLQIDWMKKYPILKQQFTKNYQIDHFHKKESNFCLVLVMHGCSREMALLEIP